MVGTIGAIVPMEGGLITHGYGTVGATEDITDGVGTAHGDGIDGTTGAGAVIMAMDMATDGVDGIPLTTLGTVIMETDIIIGIMDDMATIGIMP